VGGGVSQISPIFTPSPQIDSRPRAIYFLLELYIHGGIIAMNDIEGMVRNIQFEASDHHPDLRGKNIPSNPNRLMRIRWIVEI